MPQYLDEFADFVAGTGPLFLPGPQEIINDDALLNYQASDLMLKTKREVQGGASINVNSIMTGSSDAQHVMPGQVMTINQRSYLTTQTIPWRFTMIDIPFNLRVTGLNEGAGRDARFQTYTRIRDAGMMGKTNDIVKKIETSLVAAAVADMENADGKTPYSMFATITSDGLAPAGFTTVQKVNRTTTENARNRTAGYSSDAIYDVDNGLIAGFDEMASKVNFKSSSMMKKFTKDAPFSQLDILTNKQGRTNYQKCLRANNDITRVGSQDPAYPDPMFNGISIRAVEAFDLLGSFTTDKPGYLFVNNNYLHVVCHQGHWMEMTRKYFPTQQPDTVLFYYNCEWNLVNMSPRHQGYLSAN